MLSIVLVQEIVIAKCMEYAICDVMNTSVMGGTSFHGLRYCQRAGPILDGRESLGILAVHYRIFLAYNMYIERQNINPVLCLY